MKKLLILGCIIILTLSLMKEEKVIIPKESIRFRVIANSDLEKDQQIKRKVVKNLTPMIKKMNSLNSLEESRTFINNNLPKFTTIVDKTLKEEEKNQNFTINYGKNYFPEKIYKNVVYEEGEYESLVVTLGDGLGKNFWCVLFPPICLIDEENEKVEYKSFIKEILDKYF
ncbi:MAG: stage II sporulation protein R [Bacilli bacterium]|nr:stage II sporulation protein R [Bacilli bacterium]